MAGGTMIDSFFVTFGLDASKYKKGSEEIAGLNKKTAESSDKMAKDIEKHHADLAGAFSKSTEMALTFFAAVAGGVALDKLYGSTVNVTAATGRAAKNFGMAASDLSGYVVMLQKIGGTADDANTSLNALTQGIEMSISTGNPSDAAGVLTRGMGINIIDPNSPTGFRDPKDILAEIGDWMKNHNPQQDLQIGRRLGLPDSVTNLLEQGGASFLAGLSANATTNPAAVQAGEDIQSAEAGLQGQITKVRNDFMVLTAPEVISGINAFAKVMTGLDLVLEGKKPWSYLLGDQPPSVAPAPPPPSGNAAQVNDQIMTYLRGKGLTKNQAAMIAGGLYSESQGNPASINPKSGASGIAQWLGLRLTDFQSKHGGLRPDQTSLKTQLDYMWSELNSSEKSSLDAVKAGVNVANGAADFGANYERPYSSMTPKQIADYRRLQGVTAERLAGLYGLPPSVQHVVDWLGKPANQLFTTGGDLSPKVNGVLANLRAQQHIVARSGSHVTINNHLGPITVHTQATDARGTADAVSHSVQKVLVTNSKKGLR